MNTSAEKVLLSKVPEVTLIFWVIKIAATTLGETGGDAVSMSMNLGYLISTAIFSAVFLAAVVAQIRPRHFSRCSTGLLSLQPPRLVQRWLILQTDLLVLVTLEAHFYLSFYCAALYLYGIGH